MSTCSSTSRVTPEMRPTSTGRWTGRPPRRAATTPINLSHGQRKLVGVARALVMQPKLVLLDEPAAGLDTARAAVLGRAALAAGAVSRCFMIDHDMGLVLSVCDYIYVLDFGRIIAEGTPAEIRDDPLVIDAYLGESASEVRERTSLVTRASHDARCPLASSSSRTCPPATAGVPVVRGLNLHVDPGEVVALLGPNGAGKTTTLLTCSGIVKVLTGSVSILGEPVHYGVAHRWPAAASGTWPRTARCSSS